MTHDPRSQPDLATENARLRSANAKLVEACKRVRDMIARDLTNFGPCDHDVGICYCVEGMEIEILADAIAAAEAQP